MAQLFTSTGNNFGAGSISFKSHQEQNFVVLNAKFSYDPTNEEYQAADILEIYVPDLSIKRSAITGVFMTFRDRYVYSSYTWNNDGGTVLKSWIKDKNTICIEKLTDFDSKGEITIYIQALYTALGRGGNTVKGTRTRINVTVEGDTQYLRFGSETFCVIRQLQLRLPKPALGMQPGRLPHRSHCRRGFLRRLQPIQPDGGRHLRRPYRERRSHLPRADERL